MTTHNIIGHEDAGAHVVIRHAAPRRRGAFWWTRTIIEAAVCLAFAAMIWDFLT